MFHHLYPTAVILKKIVKRVGSQRCGPDSGEFSATRVRKKFEYVREWFAQKAIEISANLVISSF